MHCILRNATGCSITFVALLALGCGDDDTNSATSDASTQMEAGGGDCSKEMFDKYGLEAFVAVNDSIIANAVAAPTSMVGTSFQDLAAEGETRVEEFRTNLANFLVLVYGGPNSYTGPDMMAAHAGLGITSEQYDFFVTSVIVPSLMENGVPEEDISNCFAPPVVDADFKASIVGQ